MRNRTNGRRFGHFIRRVEPALTFQQARRKQGVDHRALTHSCLAYHHDIELEATVHHLELHLLRHRIKTYIPVKGRRHRLWHRHGRPNGVVLPASPIHAPVALAHLSLSRDSNGERRLVLLLLSCARAAQ